MHNVLDLHPSCCLFVHSFVCRLLSTCERYTSETNELTVLKIGINLPLGQGHERSTMGSVGQWSMVKVTRGRIYVWKTGGDIILHLLSRVDRGMQ